MEDFVILRSHGNRIFLLAVVLDDIDMGITKVIRGEHLPEAVCNHLALLGWGRLDG